MRTQNYTCYMIKSGALYLNAYRLWGDWLRATRFTRDEANIELRRLAGAYYHGARIVRVRVTVRGEL